METNRLHRIAAQVAMGRSLYHPLLPMRGTEGRKVPDVTRRMTASSKWDIRIEGDVDREPSHILTVQTGANDDMNQVLEQVKERMVAFCKSQDPKWDWAFKLETPKVKEKWTEADGEERVLWYVGRAWPNNYESDPDDDMGIFELRDDIGWGGEDSIP